MKTAALALAVLTLNVAGPRRVLQGWPSRREALTARLKTMNADVAAYQQLWRPEDVEALAEAAGHAARASDPALGLAVTARLPLDGRDSRALGGGGAVLRARLRARDREFDVYSARLTPGDGARQAARLGQMFRLAEFVRAESSTRPFVLLGDLGTGADERESGLLLDMLEARDLCVSHGDEVCGRTLGDRRVDYALIPYSSREPREKARAVFTELPAMEDEDGAPAGLHFGLRAVLDEGFLSLKPAVSPAGRDEALSVVASALESARDEAAERSRRAGWWPWLGTKRALDARREAAEFDAMAEEVRTARLRASARRPARPLD